MFPDGDSLHDRGGVVWEQSDHYLYYFLLCRHGGGFSLPDVMVRPLLTPQSPVVASIANTDSYSPFNPFQVYAARCG